jgi:hypothetical protein
MIDRHLIQLSHDSRLSIELASERAIQSSCVELNCVASVDMHSA